MIKTIKVTFNIIRNLWVKNLFNIILNLFVFKKDIYLDIWWHSFQIRAKTWDLYMFYQTFVQKEYSFDLKYLNWYNPKYIIDWWANIGDSVFYFNNFFKNSTIDAIELEQNIFVQLKKNTNWLNDIRIHKNAIWNKDDLNLNIYDFWQWDCAYTISDIDDKKSETIIDSVKTITINELWKNSGFRYIDIVKLDIEWAEKEVFENENCQDRISNTNIIIVELHDWMKKWCWQSFYNATSKHDFFQIINWENIILIRNDILRNE